MLIRALFDLAVKGAATILYGLAAICIVAPLFPLIFLGEMVVSFTPHIVLGGLLCSGLLARQNPRAAIAGAAFVLVAIWPVITFAKFETSAKDPCSSDSCLSILTANIHGSEAALQRLVELAADRNVDLIAINEPPRQFEDANYAAAVPGFDTHLYINRQSTPRPVGMPIALLARDPFHTQDVRFPSRLASRAYLQADLDAQWQDVRIVVLHAMVPVTPRGMIARNTLIASAADTAQGASSFIMLGDFNMTPWSTTFRRLPGKRAGDPRGVSTWPVAFGPFGIAIDHIIFSGDLELVETEELPAIGSDHRAVLARFRRPAQQ